MAERKGDEPGSENPMARGYAKAEERNRAVREALPPLAPGERPGAVTAGAIFAGLVAAIFWASLVAALLGAEIDGKQPNPIQLIAFAGVMSAMAFGMWKVRYWAVLGFQMLLVLFLLAVVAGLLTAESLIQALGTATLALGILHRQRVAGGAGTQAAQHRIDALDQMSLVHRMAQPSPRLGRVRQGPHQHEHFTRRVPRTHTQLEPVPLDLLTGRMLDVDRGPAGLAGAAEPAGQV